MVRKLEKCIFCTVLFAVLILSACASGCFAEGDMVFSSGNLFNSTEDLPPQNVVPNTGVNTSLPFDPSRASTGALDTQMPGAAGQRSLNEAMGSAASTQMLAGQMLLSGGESGGGESPRISWNNTNLLVYIDGVKVENNSIIQKPLPFTVTVDTGLSSGTVVTECVLYYGLSYKYNNSDYLNEDEEPLPNSISETGRNSGVFSHRVDIPNTLELRLNSGIRIEVKSYPAYPVRIGGERVTDRNKDNILEQGFAISYNPDRSLLVLNNATINGRIELGTPVTILFSGTNVITGDVQTVNGASQGCGIYSTSGLVLSSYSAGDSLTVSAPGAHSSCAIEVNGGSLTVGSGANVSAQSLSGTVFSAGVSATGNVEVSGRLSATAGNAASSCGLKCAALTVKNVNATTGGEIYAYGGDCYSGGDSVGIYTAGNATVEYGAKLNAWGKGASGASRGVSAGGSFTNQGTAVCYSGNAGGDSIALSATGSVSSSGTLNANGGNSSAGASCGIRASGLTVTGGAVDARAVSGAAGSRGINAPTVISGGTVTADGGSCALSATPTFSGYSPRLLVSDHTSDPYEADAAVSSNFQKKYVMIQSKVLSVSPASVTIQVGQTYQLTASVSPGCSVKWFSSNPNVQADAVTGCIQGKYAGTAVVTAQAYNSAGGEVGQAMCSVTVTEKEQPPQQVQPAAVHFDQENITFHSAGGMRTVQYWLTPSTASDADLIWTNSDRAGNTVRVEVSKENHEFTVIALGNGTALITATTPNGKEASCRVTVSDIRADAGNGQTVSCYIDYLDNNGTWYYDWSDGFRVTCTGPGSSLLGIYMDNMVVPEYSNGQRNWMRSSPNGKTDITFTRAYMSTLSHTRHTLSLSYSGAGTTSKPIYIQSLRDAPRTGDQPFHSFIAAWFLSGTAAAGAGIILKRRKKHGI